MNKSALKMGRVEWAMLLLLASLWGTSFLFMRIATKELPVFTVSFGRIGIAAFILTLYTKSRRLSLSASAQQWGQLLLLGFLRAALPITLFVWASARIDSGLSGILNSTTPLFTAIIAHFFTSDESLTTRRIGGIALGIVGIVCLIGPTALQGLGDDVLGQLAVLGATTSYGFAGVHGRRFKQMPVPVTTASFLLGATVLLTPLALLDQPWALRPSTTAIAAVLALAALNTAFAFMVWLALLLRAGANNTAQVTFVIPLVALVLGWLVLGEQIGWNAVAGLAFILIGLAVAQGRIRLSRH